MSNDVNLSETEKITLEIIAAFKPKIYRDGDSWCCLYGENIQEGICGFGENPMNAVYHFYLVLFEPAKSKQP